MSTAVLISGQFRTFRQCLPTQQWHVYRHFPDLHFFLVMQNTPDAPGCVALLEEKYGKDRVHAKLIEDPTDLPMIALKHGLHAPYANAAPHPQLLMQHWYQNEVWRWFNETKPIPKFRVVIRMRGDNFFHSFKNPMPERAIVDGRVCFTPWWGRFGGVNDRFAVMNEEAAEGYFAVYPHIAELMACACPFHPESLLAALLEQSGMGIADCMKAEFSTHRENGQHRFPEISPIDIAHLAASGR